MPFQSSRLFLLTLLWICFTEGRITKHGHNRTNSIFAESKRKVGEVRHSDPLNDISAIGHMDPSVLYSIPVKEDALNQLAGDIPGAPLSPEEMNYELPQSNEVEITPGKGTDPIFLARAYEGDIIVSDRAELLELTRPLKEEIVARPRNAVIEPNRVWPNKEIPYVISSSYDQAERGIIAIAMRNFQTQTCIKFVPRISQTDYIHIYKGEGCSSSVGKVGGHQAVSLGIGCVYVGIVMHELMHAAGFWHEQSRFDRDNYIRIFWNNIKDGMEYNFRKYDWNTIAHLDVAYDPGSIMHYGEKSFAKDTARNTIEAINGQEIGQRRGFSKLDVAKLNKLYRCNEEGPIKVTTPHPTTGIGETGGKFKECRDDDTSNNCGTWARSGECEKNPQYMHVYCAKSCNTCDCNDQEQHCGYWAGIGECTKNAAYMHLYCKQSCGLCHSQSDVTADCVDQNEYCQAWAASGLCHAHTEYMITFCKKSCTDCVPKI